MGFIQNLQNKPESQKRIILFLIVGILMVFVFYVWVFQFRNSLKMRTKKQNEDLTSLSELTENIKDTYKNSTEKIKEIKGTLEELE